jgi:hypothetical protein
MNLPSESKSENCLLVSCLGMSTQMVRAFLILTLDFLSIHFKR